ncbi:type IV toxin-antitoxin system AbiEi family antitoxin [Erwinia aphidicola]|uniref:type IV toxin-antitoxin system AbiEi family antitoxin n=1 Tax=Erwinia aphidicola TaxID=68334 RepID=UPI00300C4F0E
MHDEAQLLEKVLTNLPEALKIEDIRWSRNLDFHDGRLTLRTPDGAAFTFLFTIKLRPRKEILQKMHSIFRQNSTHPALLICERLSPAMTQYCEENHINFIDSGGNACMALPALFLRISGRKLPPVIRERPRISEGVMKLLFVLLTQPGSINENYRQLASYAGISLGMVSKAFDYLETERHYRSGKQGRRLTDPDWLMAEWIREYASVLRPKLKTLQLECDINWRSIELEEGECWGGEPAGYLLSDRYLKPEILQLFTHSPLTERRKSLRLKPHPSGKFILTQAFWGKDFSLTERAKTVLCVAELIASRDDRNIETAGRINEKHLHISQTHLFGN